MSLTERERAEILERLVAIERQLDEIQRNLDLIVELHEITNPEALERARREVEEDTDD